VELLGHFHPKIVHFPVALILAGAVFELIGRAVSLEWWRKAAFAMLIAGVLGAGLAVASGLQAEEPVEHQGVPDTAIEAHEEVALLTLYLGIAAVLARLLAGRLRGGRALVSGLALVLHLAAAVTVGIAAHRGGLLVYDHGAAVKIDGQPVRSGPEH